MRPAIDDGDRILVRSDVGSLNRGEIVEFAVPYDQDSYYIKRIIGLPGETLVIRSGSVFINGKEIAEPYIDRTNNQTVSESDQSWDIPKEEYFVMGDNRDNSSDSRSWGTVHKDLVRGKYFTSY